jgi:Flp pilus assembly protein TadB
MRDLDSNKAKYKELKEKYLEAKLSQSLEDEQRSERFSVSESAVVPTKPEKPERLKVLLMGLVASVVCGIGIGVGAEILTGGVRGQQAVMSLTGMQPLVVIPYIQNQQDIDSARKKKNRFIILCCCLFVITVIVVHTLYMPLNTIFSKVLNKAVGP